MSSHRDSPSPTRPPTAALFGSDILGRRVRRLFATDGREWHVRECVSPYERGLGAGISLIFESTDVARRVTTFPASWIECSDDELMALCNGWSPESAAEPVETICVFDQAAGVRFVDTPSRIVRPGLVYRGCRYARFTLSALFGRDEAASAVVYCAAPPGAADELAIFRALFPNCSGVFRLEADSS